MAMRADILEIARVLSDASALTEMSAFRAPSPLGEEATRYAELMPKLPRHPDVPGALVGAEFKPLFLLNGLIHAAAMPRMPRRLLLEALSAGLLEFVDYFEALAGGGALENAADKQKRYFAYCLAQLVECGVDLTTAMTIMKGDALDQGSAYEVRSWLEDGPDAMLRSALLTDRERDLFSAVFSEGRAAWPALRDHLVTTYSLPFRPAPAR